ncbi:hypothetical protein HZS_1459 [Henneguya salminicola]|nr:hypothetical protein HZS_1459 [Henneguya salminicola]
MLSVIAVDFENSLILAVKHEFNQSRILGLSRIQLILDYIELLTLIPINKISLGIEYIKIKTIKDHDAILF